MRKPKSRGKKKKIAPKRTPRPTQNPGWLRAEPDGKAPPPPVWAQAALLPFIELKWEDFERLCLRLSERGANVEAAWAYGKSGHAQFGIDILVRKPDGAFHVWQTKRYKSISKSVVKEAVTFFLKHKWAGQAARFVLALACEFTSPGVVEAIEEARTTLKARNIEFEALDASKLTERLRTEPELVDDFFRRPWVEAICPPEALGRLQNRLSRFDLASLRESLHSFYNSWISTVDPGLPIVSQDAQGQTQATIPMAERYIQPDLLFQVAELEIPPGDKPAPTTETRRQAAELGKREETPGPGSDAQTLRSTARQRRLPLDEYLGSRTQALIVGDAGAGKTSLLRFLALDMLSAEPVLNVAKERFKGAIPVWLPFALWARMSAGRDTPAPIEDAVAEFFRAQGEPDIAASMRRAVLGKGVVLLVDGLDEAADTTAAETLVAVLTAFADRNNIPVFATSRPHGARTLTGLGGSWDRSVLAALSDEQRLVLARLWFGVLERFEAGSSATKSQIRSRATRKAAAFIADLQVNAGIARLSQTPLFLLAFLSLHRRGQNLPRNRFGASQEIVDQLIEHQPRHRAVSALSTRSASGEPRLRDRVIADFAFALQSGDLRGSIPDAAAQEEAVARAARLIRERQQSTDADNVARSIFSFTEERAGLLVNKAPGNVGFLHLSLQEYLAARHLMQRPIAEKISFVSENAGRARWREPILYLLFLTVTEAEAGQLLETIANAPAADPQARTVRDALLTDAVFADFAHDLGVVRRFAAAAFETAELNAWGERRRHLLHAVVDGLFSESVGGMCRAKLVEWLPDRHGYGRAAAVQAMPAWRPSLRPASIEASFRCLRCENEYVWRKAAEILPLVAGATDAIRQRLTGLAREAPSVQTAQAALVSLGAGWSDSDEVGAMAQRLRSSDHKGLCLDAIWILARRRETETRDLDRYFAVAFGRDHWGRSLVGRDIAEHFATYHREAFAAKLEDALARLMGDRIGRVIPLIAALFLCDSDHPLAHKELLQALHHDWILHDIFTPGHFPVDRVHWTPDLTARIEALVGTKERFIENDLYWISKVAPLPLLKQKFLEALRERQHLRFWCSRALAEVWGKADPEVQAIFASMLTAEPEAVADVAEELPLVIDDRTGCRDALLRAMRADVTRYDFILKGCKNLGIGTEDEEMVAAALQAGARKRSPLYRDAWCEGIINAFPTHPEVCSIALAELMRRDGSLGAVASNYPDDEDMCRRVLDALCPLDDKARMTLVQAIEAAAPSNDAAEGLLSATREDTDGLVCSESAMGWVEAALTRGGLSEDGVRWLEEELNAVGPEYEKRRTAAVVGLLLTGNIGRFVQAKRYDGKPLDVETSPDLTRDDLYLRRLLPHWTELTAAFGSEQAVLERFSIGPERTLRVMHAGLTGSDHLFALLMDQAPNAQHLHKSDVIAAVAEMAPQSKRMRELIASLLLAPFGGRSVADHWAELKAGEIFAQYFRNDLELRNRVIDTFKSNPEHAAAAGALAELLLREDDPDLGKLLGEQVQGRRYTIGVHFKLIAALSPPEVFIEAIEDLLARDIEPDDWALSYWMPTLLRRINIDRELQEKMYAALCKAGDVSLKITLSALLNRGAGPADNLKQYAGDELQKLQQEPVPLIGFDLTSYTHRPLFQVLTELAA